MLYHERLRQMRTVTGYTQREVAAVLGTRQNDVSRREQGKDAPYTRNQHIAFVGLVGGSVDHLEDLAQVTRALYTANKRATRGRAYMRVLNPAPAKAAKAGKTVRIPKTPGGDKVKGALGKLRLNLTDKELAEWAECLLDALM
jgi:transcriptional regulator with XRE-family HTH domain